MRRKAAPTAVGEWSHFPFPGSAPGVWGEEAPSQKVGRLLPKPEPSVGPMGQMRHEAASSGRSLHITTPRASRSPENSAIKHAAEERRACTALLRASGDCARPKSQPAVPPNEHLLRREKQALAARLRALPLPLSHLPRRISFH